MSSLYSFDINGNGLDLVFKLDQPCLNFASSIYQDRKMIISGGALGTGTLLRSAFELTYKINEMNRALSCTYRALPSMK